MTALNTIMDTNWDTGICAKPTFITTSTGNWRGYGRVFSSQKVSRLDDIIGTLSREYFDPDAHDAYEVIISSTTSQADIENMIKAVKKVCATYTPTSAENILNWAGGDLDTQNGFIWTFRLVILVVRAGVPAY